jgi:hypothetical protein
MIEDIFGMAAEVGAVDVAREVGSEALRPVLDPFIQENDQIDATTGAQEVGFRQAERDLGRFPPDEQLGWQIVDNLRATGHNTMTEGELADMTPVEVWATTGLSRAVTGLRRTFEVQPKAASLSLVPVEVSLVDDRITGDSYDAVARVVKDGLGLAPGKGEVTEERVKVKPETGKPLRGNQTATTLPDTQVTFAPKRGALRRLHGALHGGVPKDVVDTDHYLDHATDNYVDADNHAALDGLREEVETARQHAHEASRVDLSVVERQLPPSPDGSTPTRELLLRLNYQPN